MQGSETGPRQTSGIQDQQSTLRCEQRNVRMTAHGEIAVFSLCPRQEGPHILKSVAMAQKNTDLIDLYNSFRGISP